MLTVERRDLVRGWLLDRARADKRITGAAVTGSAAHGGEDRWSDVDLFLGVQDDMPVADVVADWSSLLYTECGAVHHFDLRGGPATYRAFLLDSGLEVDLGFTPTSSFGPMGDGAFDAVFGTPVQRQAGQIDTDHLIGLSWHHALHARMSIERNAGWQAEYWISALRDHTITLACIRHGLPSRYGKGAQQLPDDEREPLEHALIASLDLDELSRALTRTIHAFLQELQHTDPDVAARLHPLLLTLAGDEA